MPLATYFETKIPEEYLNQLRDRFQGVFGVVASEPMHPEDFHQRTRVDSLPYEETSTVRLRGDAETLVPKRVRRVGGAQLITSSARKSEKRLEPIVEDPPFT